MQYLSIQDFKEINYEQIKAFEPKQYLFFMANCLRNAAGYKANLFVWIENNNYEILSLDEETINHLIKEECGVLKKEQTELNDSVDYIDKIVCAVFEKTALFEDFDCISLSMVCTAFLSYEMKLISEEEYLEIRDFLVPYKLMISQCKTKSDKLLEIYKSLNNEEVINAKLYSKLGKGIEQQIDISLIKKAFDEITYDEKSWEKE